MEGRTGRDAGDDDRHRSSIGGQNVSRLLSVDGRTRARRAVPPDQLGNCRAHCWRGSAATAPGWAERRDNGNWNNG